VAAGAAAFWGVALFRWDINVRESAVLGLVGAGGIGVVLDDAINFFQWPRVATSCSPFSPWWWWRRSSSPASGRAPVGTMEQACDILVVGGGVKRRRHRARPRRARPPGGAAERGDLAQATSSSSSKLIHAAALPRALRVPPGPRGPGEREVLLRTAPHIIWPLRFVLPHRPEMRPRWLIRAGLFLYDNLARRVSLPAAESFRTAGNALGAALKPEITHAFAYLRRLGGGQPAGAAERHGCAQRGGDIRTRTSFEGRHAIPHHWQVSLRAEGGEPGASGRAPSSTPPALGPGRARRCQLVPPGAVRLIRGSHIVLRRLYEGEHAFILQNDDRRVVFVIPYEGKVLAGRHHRRAA
jgi:glycerol-3-phosphate dehydrogenase